MSTCLYLNIDTDGLTEFNNASQFKEYDDVRNVWKMMYFNIINYKKNSYLIVSREI